MKKTRKVFGIIFLAMSLLGCSRKTNQTSETRELNVFVAASLNKVMTEIVQEYKKQKPDVKILLNADSSGTLMTQIREGYSCDIFFSAAQSQMNTLEKEGFLVPESRHNVLNNKLVVIALKDSTTRVRGIENLEEAASLALAGPSVPAGKYTRLALEKLGKLSFLENLEVSEQTNVSKVVISVLEGSCETGTAYYSDIYGFEDKLKIIQEVPQELTGDIIYPAALIKNESASEVQKKAAEDFLQFILKSKEIFKSYYFDPVL